ncbi:MAG: gliding motility-associated ABC transporter permease subunit GldF [Bacteroidetes bacterium]|nr:gliding motility-associated ABC transporter permease subunit GldF [Bacteroidota bacterium]MBU1718615.1 gliding motility-associated ABC transporter permease subunit GldF [Bacteroidota bacterium]
MVTLLKKEISSFFGSLLGYIVIGVFLTINGLFLWVFPMDFNIMNMGYSSLDGLFKLAPWVYLFLIPAITMRSFADERKSGTIEFLLTKPLTDFHIVFSKYLASTILVFFSLIPSLIYLYSVSALGNPPANLDWGATLGSYIGLLFLGAVFVSIGLFSSSITDNQIIAFIISIFLCGFFYTGFEFIYSLDWFGSVDLLIRNLGISAHYSSISRGVVDTRDIIYFLSVIAAFLIFTKISLQSRKW